MVPETNPQADGAADKFVGFGVCHDNREACKKARRWVIGLIVVVLVPISGIALTFAMNAKAGAKGLEVQSVATVKTVDDFKKEVATDIGQINADVRTIREDQKIMLREAAAHQRKMVEQVAEISTLVRTHVATDRSP